MNEGTLRAGAGVVIAVSLLLPGCERLEAPAREPGLTNANAILPADPCAPMTPAQAQRADVALAVLRDFPRQAPIYREAMGHFGRARDLGDDQPFCLDEQIRQQISEATLGAEAWDYALPGLPELYLARQLGPRNEAIVVHVANGAFRTTPISEWPYADIRPMARSVLASFGKHAAPWRDEALEQMHARDTLGTSAAQVAAASQDPGAVGAVARLFEQTLSQTPDDVIPRDKAKRLSELAFAIGAAGEAGRPYINLLTNLLARDVESAAPPFGIIARTPTEVCWALEMIGGPETGEPLSSERCEGAWFRGPG